MKYISALIRRKPEEHNKIDQDDKKIIKKNIEILTMNLLAKKTLQRWLIKRSDLSNNMYNTAEIIWNYRNILLFADKGIK